MREHSFHQLLLSWRRGGADFTGLLVTGLPIILAVMGAVIAIWPPDTPLRRALWIAAFVLAGAAAVVASYMDRRNTAQHMLGGDQFCFVMALFGPGMDPKGQFPLVVTNPWDHSLYDVTIGICPRGSFPVEGRTISLGTLHPNQSMRELGVSISVGDYVLDIRTRASPHGFFQRLILTADDNGKIRQQYYVRRIGSTEMLMDAQ